VHRTYHMKHGGCLFVNRIPSEVTQKTSRRRIGYTKSVDMWSLGCVTVVLLTGGLPFKDPETFSFSRELALDCNLEKLKIDEDWIHVGERAKDFVYRLLILDENERMDVKQALQHSWFTNAAHKAEFDDVYRRAIKDWEPQSFGEPRAIAINSSGLECSRQMERRGTNESAILSPDSVSSAASARTTLGRAALPSPTLSDVDISKRDALQKTDVNVPINSKGQETQANGLNLALRLPFSLNAWTDNSAEKEGKDLEDDGYHPLHQPCQSVEEILATRAQVEADTANQGAQHNAHGLCRPRKYRIISPKKRRLADIYELEEDET
jgi:serine/threonine protein kinase